MTLTEPDVALTDYALAAECLLLAFLLSQQNVLRRIDRGWIVSGFVALSVASLLGGTVHGFFAAEMTRGHKILWTFVLLSIGVVSLIGWTIAARILFSSNATRWATIFGTLGLALYLIVVVFVNQTYQVAILCYLPSNLFLLIASFHLYRQTPVRPALTGLLGVALTFTAPLFQQFKIGLPSLHLNHNAVYHLVQAVALLMMFQGARWYIGKDFYK